MESGKVDCTGAVGLALDTVLKVVAAKDQVIDVIRVTSLRREGEEEKRSKRLDQHRHASSSSALTCPFHTVHTRPTHPREREN